MSEINVTGILERYQGDPSALIAILQDIQEEHRYLPREALDQITESLDIPLSQSYSLATFFKAFSLEPRGQHSVSVCLGTACHVRGGQKILEKLERDLGVKAGGTTEDLNFTLEEVHCLGCCGLAPVVTVDDDLYGKLSLTKVSRVIKKYLPKAA
jgi:NADH-quinone oxidoreductase subunit E